MKAIKLASSDADRSRLRSRCMKVLERAEDIKKLQTWPPLLLDPQNLGTAPKQLKAPRSMRSLSVNEQRILLESSRLHGLKFPQWTDDPDAKTFERDIGEPLFMLDSQSLFH